MINRKLLIILIFLLISNCGYEPLISKKTNFSLKLIELSGDTKINYIIKNRLKIFEDKNNNYILEIVDSNVNKIVASMDTKGNPKTFRMTINLAINLKKKSDLTAEVKKFTATTNYNTISSKFNLKKYEENITENLTEKILDELILYIQTQ